MQSAAVMQGAIREPSLKTQLRRAERRRRMTAFALVLPLILFLLFTFGIPIATMLWRAVYDPQIDQIMPRTTLALAHWDGHALPGEDAYRAVALDLKQAAD